MVIAHSAGPVGGTSRAIWVDDHAWPLSEAIQASAQWVLVIDQVISDQRYSAPYRSRTRRTQALPVEDRACTATGHRRGCGWTLLFLWPNEQFLKVVEIQP